MAEGLHDEVAARTVGDPWKVREVFDALPLIAGGFEGPQLRAVATSALWRESLGRSEVIGVPLREIFAEMTEQQTAELYEQVFATGQSAVLREYRAQWQAEDGTPIDMFLDFVLTPMRAADGTVTGVIASATDVTAAVQARRAAEQQAGEAQRRYAEARDVIQALQRELLPRGVPALPRLQVAASYLLADAETAAGGDWFDAVVLADTRIALIVGDVVGHGVAASAAMGQLRVVLHEWLQSTGDLRAAVGAADRAARSIGGARAATVCVVVLDPRTGRLSYCTAGHPPPLVLAADGGSRYLPSSGAGALGVGGSHPTADDHLGAGEVVLLYTDGILERPGRDLAGATVELARVAADVSADRVFRGDSPSTVDRLATQTLELLTRTSGHSDDITVLAAQRVEAPDDFVLRMPAAPGSLRAVRECLDQWLSNARIDRRDIDAFRHAVVELVANVTDHAFLDAPGVHMFDVTLILTDAGQLQARVTDQGRWREPQPSPDRGLGLRLVEGLVDTLRLEHDESGTTATVTLQASVPARLLTAGGLGRRSEHPRLQTEPLLVWEQPSAPRPRIRVDGPIDGATVDEFERLARLAGVTGARSLTVDMTGVTHLASVGVAALHQLLALHRDNGTTLRVYAPSGTPANMILSLVQITHHTLDPDYPPQTLE